MTDEESEKIIREVMKLLPPNHRAALVIWNEDTGESHVGANGNPEAVGIIVNHWLSRLRALEKGEDTPDVEMRVVSRDPDEAKDPTKN